MNKANYHRSKRMSALDKWAQHGVLEQRDRMPIESDFVERVTKNTRVFFRPSHLKCLESVSFQRELSYLVDAFDFLPERVDIAFDFVWKAFELETKKCVRGSTAARLQAIAPLVNRKVIARLCHSMPVQACEFLFKRLVSDELSNKADPGLRKRIELIKDNNLEVLLEHMRTTYGSPSDNDLRRKGAMFLKRVMNGETMELNGYPRLNADSSLRAHILISLYLYTARNGRVHGDSFSPFLSSKAKIRTYTHPYFAFLSTYYLLLCAWQQRKEQVVINGDREILKSLDDNLECAIRVFGSHWNK